MNYVLLLQVLIYISIIKSFGEEGTLLEWTGFVLGLASMIFIDVWFHENEYSKIFYNPGMKLIRYKLTTL